MPDIHFSIEASVLASHYSASVSSFPCFPAPPHSGFPSASVLPRRFPRFPPSPPPGFPCFLSGFWYLAFCLFPFIPPGFAPTAVPPVLPLCSRFRAFPLLPLSFVRFRLVLTTQPSVLSFPFFPFSPVGGSSGASFLFRPACFHAFLPISVLSFLHFFSPLAVSPHSGCLSASAFLLSVSGLFPMAFALGSGYSAFNISSSETSARVSLSFCRELLYNIIFDSICQHIFYKFQNFYFPVFYGFPDSPHPAPIWKQPIGSHPAGPVLPVINGALF